MTDLLDVVDELTIPRVEHIPQRTDQGEWVRTHTVEHAALFVQLRDAGSGRTSAGSNASKHERSIVDVDALHLYAQYSAQVADWCRILGVAYTREPVHDLRAWYAATLHDNTFTTAAADAYRVILSRWVNAIREHFDPPRWEDSNLPCPSCGATMYGDAVNGGGKAVRLMFRVDENTGRTFGERALCRACGLVWLGYDSVMELVDEQKEKRSSA